MAPQHATQEQRSNLVRLATIASVSVALLLIFMKFGAWVLSDSISLQATLIDSVLDAIASLINFFVVREALRPADAEHRFGHGKMEALAALGQSTFIAGSAVWLSLEAGRRAFAPPSLESPAIGMIVMVISVLLTLALLAFQNHVIKKTHSPAIKADATHYKSDILINIGVFVALACYDFFGIRFLDPLFGFIIAGYILFTAFGISKEAIDMLVDRELSDEIRGKIKEIALNHPNVTGIHDLRTRSAGQQTFIQLHLEMDGNLSLSAAHVISDEVSLSLLKDFPHAEVIIHQDPYQLSRMSER